MRIISWNVNGLRAVYRKDFLGWMAEMNADIACLQEIKLQREQPTFDFINPPGYFSYFNPAIKKGYAGVVIYTKKKPLAAKRAIGLPRFDDEGRILQLEYSNFTLINLYLPHGGRDKEKLGYKLGVYDRLLKYLEKLKNQKIILAGDFNIAHQDIDLARPKDNKNNIMFTPQEREQIDKLLDLGFIDTFRKFHLDGGHYSWWPYRLNARQRNLGWRIDYLFVSRPLARNLKNAFILPEVTGSDHCPVGIEITF